MDAVILAAGLGRRIRSFHDLPKGFISIGGASLIEQSIKILRFYGINDILIVTGYRADCYEAFIDSQINIDTVINEHYADTGSLYSLYLAKSWVKRDFLLLESDLLYDESLIECLLKQSHPNALLMSGETRSGDEVYVEVKDDYLVNMSKNKKELHSPNIKGEFVGITKLSFSSFKLLVTEIERNIESCKKEHYETNGLVSLANKFPIYCQKIINSLWCEIDDEQHFIRAKELYQKIRQHSKAIHPR